MNSPDFQSDAPGVQIFRVGMGYEAAFYGAIEFLRSSSAGSLQSDRLVVLGEQVSIFAQDWLQSRIIEDGEALSGKKVFTWKEWISFCARSAAIEKGVAFNAGSDLEEREFLRSILRSLEEHELLGSYKGLWEEERFFSELLMLIREFRRKGFSTELAIENLRESLVAKGEEGKSLEKHDLWTILTTWERARSAVDNPPLDVAAQVELLRTNGYTGPRSIYLLGVESLGASEIDFLEQISESVSIFWPIACGRDDFCALVAGKRGSCSNTVSVSIDSAYRLIQTFAQNRVQFHEAHREYVEPKVAEDKVRIYPLLHAHTELEEIRTVGAFLRERLQSSNSSDVQIIAPRGYFQSEAHRKAWSEFLPETTTGLFPGRAVMDQGYVPLLLNSIQLLVEDFPTLGTIDLIDSMNIGHEEERNEIVRTAFKKGVLNSYASWEDLLRSLGTPTAVLALEYISELKERFPKEAECLIFADHLEKYLIESRFFEFVRTSYCSEGEREAHAAISLLLKSAARLSVDYEQRYTLQDWLKELWLLLSQSMLEGSSLQARQISLYSPGDWIPPLPTNGLRILLDFSNSYEPRAANPYFTKDTDRSLLADWGVQTNSLKENAIHFWFNENALRTDCLALSRAKHDAMGAEKLDTFLKFAVPIEEFAWPAIAERLMPKNVREPQLSVQAEIEPPSHYSVTALDRYRTCPFLYYTEKVLKAEDIEAELSLDWRRMEEGNLTHKALELFFKDREAWEGNHGTALTPYFSKSFERAYQMMDRSFFIGGPALSHYARERLERKLLRFVIEEVDLLREFPKLTKTLTEEKFTLELPNKRMIKGSIDRIDIDELERRFVVWDYKSGSSLPSNGDIAERKNLQLPIYMWAAESLNKGQPAGAGFVSTKSAKRGNGIFVKEFIHAKANAEKAYYKTRAQKKLTVDELPEFLSESIIEASGRIEKIEQGRFPVEPDEAGECERCGVRPACRIRERSEDYSLNLPSGSFDAAARLMEGPCLWDKKDSLKKQIQFSEEQEEALSARNRLVFLEASAGSGKTTILVERYRREISFLIHEKGLTAEEAVDSVMAVSFTEKSAAEIKNRLMALLLEEHGPGIALRGVKNVSTIHGLNQRLIREHAHELGLDPMFEVLDEVEAEEVLQGCIRGFFTENLEALDEGRKQAYTRLFSHYLRSDIELILRTILEKRGFWLRDSSLAEFLKNGTIVEGSVFSDGAGREILQAVDLVARDFISFYSKEKKALGMVDFNDLEIMALDLLEREAISTTLRGNYSLILVDEFQDTNTLQRQLIDQLAKPKLGNVFVVGDAKQSIYRFRSAEVGVFQRLKEEAKSFGLVCTLNRNFRSQGSIVQFANELSQKIFPAPSEREHDFEAEYAHADLVKPVTAKVELRLFDPDPECTKADDFRRAEAKVLVKSILEAKDNGIDYSKMAILFRKLSNVDIYTEALRDAGIPFVLGSRRGFYKQSVVLDGIAFLRAIYSKENRLAQLSILRSAWFRSSTSEIRSKFTGDGLFENESWFQKIWQAKLEIRPSLALLTAYREHPLFASSAHRAQMDKLVAIVTELESGLKPWSQVVDQVSSLGGWSSENKASSSSVVSDPEAESALEIMSVHASKGLEFPTVFLPELDSGGQPDISLLRYDPSIGCAIKWRGVDGEFNKEDAYVGIQKEIQKREDAESARLFYVAVTRAEDRLILIQSKTPPKRKPSGFSWGAIVREEEWSECVNTVTVPISDLTQLKVKNVEASSKEACRDYSWREQSDLQAYRLTNLSVTELSSYVFCSEFHRLKFVQRWEDVVVDNWNVERVRRPFTKESAASPFLKRLNLSNKERGISLHRVLENLDSAKENRELWRELLLESYTAQGAPASSEDLSALVELDVATVQEFLSTELGRQVFYDIDAYYAELPITLSVDGVQISGAIDRVVRKSDGRWLVIDYKTASMEGAIERYTLQVQVYAYALRNALQKAGMEVDSIEGWIVDLFSGDGKPVEKFDAEAIHGLVAQISENYFKRSELFASGIPNLKGSDSCRVCPYTSVCATGKDFMRSVSLTR